MHLTINILNFNKENIMFSGKKKNNILENSIFYRIYYSDKLINLNGIYVIFNLKNIYISKYFNKLKCSFNIEENNEILTLIKNIETDILKLYPSKTQNSKSTHRISDQLNHSFIKVLQQSNYVNDGNMKNIEILLKISGIWGNKDKYGLTFRFFLVNHLKIKGLTFC